MKTVLAIGDEKDWDSFKKFRKQQTRLRKNGFSFKSADYQSALEGRLPEVETDELIIFLFFPFEYWENHIETKRSSETYGSRTYYTKFKRFWNRIDKLLRRAYKDKDICYVNDPARLYLGRDKRRSKLILQRKGIPVPKRYPTRDYRKILDMIEEGKKLFVKVRYGSMGKGISYLEKGRWFTNFIFRGKRIISRRSDYGWKFREVTDNIEFLKKLLAEDLVIEDAIDPFLVNGRRFDLRVYVAFGKVLYIYPRSNEPDQITTNIAQGARGEPQAFLHRIPPKILDRITRNAIRAADAMGLAFAGVDVMPDNGTGRVRVLEINAFPGFPRMRVFNLSRYIMREIAENC